MSKESKARQELQSIADSSEPFANVRKLKKAFAAVGAGVSGNDDDAFEVTFKGRKQRISYREDDKTKCYRPERSFLHAVIRGI